MNKFVLVKISNITEKLINSIRLWATPENSDYKELRAVTKSLKQLYQSQGQHNAAQQGWWWHEGPIKS
jgi:hypothetical protein